MRKVCSRCEESKPVEAFNKRKQTSDGLDSWCKSCCVEKAKEYYAKNKEKIKAYKKEYRAKNREKILAKKKEWHNANKEKIKEYRRQNKDRYDTLRKAWVEANRERLAEYYQQDHVKEKRRAYSREWAKSNPDKQSKRLRAWREANPEKRQEYQKAWLENNPNKNRHNCALRRAARIQRTPCWLTEDDMVLIQRKYTLAQKKTESTGEQWVVDHILPLQGKLVSGLHVPANLRVIKHTTNARKYNKYTPV